jgi:hypothetical protein
MFALGQEINDILLSHGIMFGQTVVYHSSIAVYIPFKKDLRDKLKDIFCDYNHKIHLCFDSNQFILKVKNG